MSTAEPNQLIRFLCKCGAVLTARAKLSGRKGKCTKCGRVQVIPREAEVVLLEEVPAGAVGIQEICSVCQTEIELDDERTRCTVCELPFHEECWQENQGCSAYGCSNVGVVKKGPDIRVNELQPMPTLRRSRRAPARQQPDDTEIPWDHVLLGASALATVLGFITCGVPNLVCGGVAVWRIVQLWEESESFLLPALSLTMCLLGLMVGLCLSSMFWF